MPKCDWCGGRLKKYERRQRGTGGRLSIDTDVKFEYKCTKCGRRQ